MLARKTCWGDPQLRHRHRLSLQVTDGTHLLGPEQLEAAYVGPCQDDQGVSSLEAEEQRPGEVEGDVNLTGGHSLREHLLPRPDVLHVREPLAWQ